MTDICDFVQGDYPKDFVLTDGIRSTSAMPRRYSSARTKWRRYQKPLPRGETYIPKGKAVTDTPKGFKKWVKGHKEQIQSAKNPPYWVRNNKAVVNGIWREKASEEKNKAEIDVKNGAAKVYRVKAKELIQGKIFFTMKSQRQ